jgi:hypothetical protein
VSRSAEPSAEPHGTMKPKKNLRTLLFRHRLAMRVVRHLEPDERVDLLLSVVDQRVARSANRKAA